MESKLQRRIIDDLIEKHGAYVYKSIVGNKPGHPDITVFMSKAKCFFIEAKDLGEEAKPLQLHRHKELRERGFKVYVIDNWEDYKKIWG